MLPPKPSRLRQQNQEFDRLSAELHTLYWREMEEAREWVDEFLGKTKQEAAESRPLNNTESEDAV